MFLQKFSSLLAFCLWVRLVRSRSYIVSTIAGIGSQLTGDGGPAESALIYSPRRLWGDTSSNLFVPDSYKTNVRKISASKYTSTVVGFDGAVTVASSLSVPVAVWGDTMNNLYILDQSKCCIQLLTNTTPNAITTHSGL